MEEIWKDINDYEGLYQISSFGQVKSLARSCKGRHIKEEIIKKPSKAKGYLRVGLSKNGTIKYYSVHRLVAEAFIENKNNLPQVHHKDSVRTNNKVENLEWCTCKENNRYKNQGLKKYVLTSINNLIKNNKENQDLIEELKKIKHKIKK